MRTLPGFSRSRATTSPPKQTRCSRCWPSATPGQHLLEEHTVTAAVRAGSVDKLLGALADPNLNPERRAMLERILEQHVFDLKPIADSPMLPEGHSLRESARALHVAFVAATLARYPKTYSRYESHTAARSPPGRCWSGLSPAFRRMMTRLAAA